MSKITKRLAVFEYTSWGNVSCLAGVQHVKEKDNDDNDSIRISKWLDVEFEAIPVEEVMPEILTGLQLEEDVENEKHNITIANIRRKKQEFLAITFQPGVKKERDIVTNSNGDGTWSAWYEDNDEAWKYGEGMGGSEQEAIDNLKAQE